MSRYSNDMLETVEADPLLLDVTLYPHRSLPRKRFFNLMAIIGFIGLIACLRFLAVGAWPVVVFVIVDIAALWLAFHLNYRSSKLYETIQLSAKDLIVTRVQPGGQRQKWRFEPNWLRVTVETIDEDTNQLVLSSHGKKLIIGAFLIPEERQSFASTLGKALSHLQPAH